MTQQVFNRSDWTLMALDHSEFLQLSKIAESLRRSDPELARKLAGPMRRRSIWSVLGYMALSVLALLAVMGAAIGGLTTPSTVVNKGTHSGERATADSRAQDRTQVDWKPAARHAPPMRTPVDYGAETP
jgi:Protein of unknown function (DUF3040)